MPGGSPPPWFVRAKPVSIGGSQGRVEATGRGVAIATREMARHLKLNLDGARGGLQGFGNVGSVASVLLSKLGCKIIAVSDTRGGVVNPDGLDPARLVEHKNRTGSVAGFPGANLISNEALLELPCEILVPSALEGQVNEDNAARLHTRLIVEGANGPVTPGADDVLGSRSEEHTSELQSP